MPDDFPQISPPGDVAKSEKDARQKLLSVQAAKHADQWIRTINLTVYKSAEGGNEAIELSNLRVHFNVKKTTTQTPNTLEARVYNMSPQTMRRVKFFSRVMLSVGYRHGHTGVLFDGKVWMYVQGKENTVDTFFDIFADDTSEITNNASIVLTYPAGTSPDQRVNILMEQAKVKVAHNDLPKEPKDPRGGGFFGMFDRAVRSITEAFGRDWFIEDGKAYIISREGYRPGESVVLSPDTGLVGIPQATPNGIVCRCLINTKLRIGGVVKIDSKWLSNVPYLPITGPIFGSFAGAEPAPGTPGGGAAIHGFNQQYQSAATSPIGTYKIIFLGHSGDTRSNPWYSDLTCIAIDASGQFVPGGVPDAMNRSVITGVPLPISKIPGGVPSKDPAHPAPTLLQPTLLRVPGRPLLLQSDQLRPALRRPVLTAEQLHIIQEQANA